MFTSAQCEKASMLVGLASRIAMRIGLHQDPGHFNFSPWVREMRRRLWNHLMYLDHPAFNGEGATSGLDQITSVRPPTNADDDQWVPTRFGKQDSAPPDSEGFRDTSWVVARGVIFGVTRRLIQLQKQGASQEELVRAAGEARSYIKRKFLDPLDETQPLQAVLASLCRTGMMYHELFNNFVAAKRTKQADMELQAK